MYAIGARRETPQRAGYPGVIGPRGRLSVNPTTASVTFVGRLAKSVKITVTRRVFRHESGFCLKGLCLSCNPVRGMLARAGDVSRPEMISYRVPLLVPPVLGDDDQAPGFTRSSMVEAMYLDRYRVVGG
jgi:hypothetical protein